jgi:S-adenosylmethionine:tRNA ribosyltransferase-isomerase
VLDLVHRDRLDPSERPGRLFLCALEPLESCIDTLPARAHQVDEQSEIVDPSVPLGEQLALESLESADRLVEEPANLGDMPCGRQNLRAESVPYSTSHLSRDRRLELGRGDGEGLDLTPRTLEDGFELGRLCTTGGGVRDSLLGAFQCEAVHGRRGYSQRRMDTAALDYELPPELIAQRPTDPRDASRLLVYRRDQRTIEHRVFSELPQLLLDELVVVNDSRVMPARLELRRASGGAVEVLLLEAVSRDGTWEALARPTRRLRAGERLGPVELVEPLGDGRWLVRVEGEPAGEVPLPPYIHEPLADPERYQTVFSREAGSAAAPTAGLHFTTSTLASIDPVRVTLHVGLDSFRPVSSSRLEEHALHGERYVVDADAWARIDSARKVLAVGTTTVRVLETVARTGELCGRTALFVTPGFTFRRVDALLTNFHLPRSTLLALVMAFVGVEEAREIYRVAIEERYRFYSFGDAMVVL